MSSFFLIDTLIRWSFLNEINKICSRSYLKYLLFFHIRCEFLRNRLIVVDDFKFSSSFLSCLLGLIIIYYIELSAICKQKKKQVDRCLWNLLLQTANDHTIDAQKCGWNAVFTVGKNHRWMETRPIHISTKYEVLFFFISLLYKVNQSMDDIKSVSL